MKYYPGCTSDLKWMTAYVTELEEHNARFRAALQVIANDGDTNIEAAIHAHEALRGQDK